MKLAITRILGGLIVLAGCYVAWWMLSGVNELLSLTVDNGNGVTVQDFTPENGVLFGIARYASILLPGLGLLILAGSLRPAKDPRRAATTNIAAGGLVFGISVFILIWGYALDFIVMIEGGPILDMSQARLLTTLTALLGLAVSGVGIAQLVKARAREPKPVERSEESKLGINSPDYCIPRLTP
jgi:hypothetical protein